MRRLVVFLAALSLAALLPAQTPPPAGAAPKQESLRDLREDVAHGKLKGAPDLCDRLKASYQDARAQALASTGAATSPQARNAAIISNFMACYCIYAKAQVQALSGAAAAAQGTLAEAQLYRSQAPEFANPRLKPTWDEMDALTQGLILEKEGKMDAAVQTYLPVSSSPKATGRLALIEWRRHRTDKARSWAFIHADDPTSEFVLAQMAVAAKNPAAAQRHVTQASGQIQRELAGGKEYMPIFFAEAPGIFALHRKLPPLPPAKPAPKPPARKPAPPPPAASPSATMGM